MDVCVVGVVSVPKILVGVVSVVVVAGVVVPDGVLVAGVVLGASLVWIVYVDGILPQAVNNTNEERNKVFIFEPPLIPLSLYSTIRHGLGKL